MLYDMSGFCGVDLVLSNTERVLFTRERVLWVDRVLIIAGFALLRVEYGSVVLPVA